MKPMFMGGGFQQVDVRGTSVEMVTKGDGPALLYLHPGHGLNAASDLLAALAQKFRVFAPSHPGFGGTEVADHQMSVDDLSYHYLDMIDALGLDQVTLVGASFGGWIASEMATKNCTRFKRLVLVGTLGAKFNDREHSQFADPFLTGDMDLPALFFSDDAAGQAAFGSFDFKTMGAEAAERYARNAEAFMRFGWSPLLHSAQLRQRLHRISVPTQLLWGENDRVAPIEYGRAFAVAANGAGFDTIADAGHYLDVEQPARVAEKIITFAC